MVIWPLFRLPEPEFPLPQLPEQVEVELPFQDANWVQVEAVLRTMTRDEKIGQLILWSPDLREESNRPGALRRAAKGRVGGLLLEQLEAGDFLELTDSFQQVSLLPMFVATQEKVSLHGQFSGLPVFPKPASIAAIDSVELYFLLEKHYLDQCKALGINLSFQPTFLDLEGEFDEHAFEQEPLANYRRTSRQIQQLANQRMIAVADGFDKFPNAEGDSLREIALKDFLVHTRAGLAGMRLDEAIFSSDSLKLPEGETIKDFLSNSLNFNGLVVSELSMGEPFESKKVMTSDQLLTAEADWAFFTISELLRKGELTEKQLDEKVRRVLSAKAWVNGGRLPVEFSRPEKTEPSWQARTVTSKSKNRTSKLQKIERPARNLEFEVDEVRCYFEHPAWKFFAQNLFEQSVVLASNQRRILPIRQLLEKQFHIFEFEGANFQTFKRYFAKYADFQPVSNPIVPLGGLPVVELDEAEGQVAVVLLDGPRLNPVTDHLFIQSVNDQAKNAEVVLVNFGYPENLQHFTSDVSLIQIFERNHLTEGYVAQALFGGAALFGRLPLKVSEDLPFASSEDIYKMRLGFGTPERTGILQERLVGINAIAETAIDNRVFPGCQVVVAKEGNVIFSRSFGHHTYSKTQPVLTSDLYDIASITKVASTTLSMMKLYDQGEVNISGRVREHLDSKVNSALGNVRIRNLMIHYSGLPPSMPIRKYFNSQSVPNAGCNDIFCTVPNNNYDVPITSNLYFRSDHQDTIWNKVLNTAPSPRRRFRYSDVNFYLLQKIIEERTNTNLAEHVNRHFYQPLGLRHLTYNPLQKIDNQRIVPTERDMAWRKSLVDGYAHDPSAALMGGIGGNAGLFSTAEDLAVLFQMLLEDGVYGGVQFLESGTVKEFSTAKYGNHRGLGFDKPTSGRKYPTYSRQAPKSTFGHNGFTGTCVWADPENELVYVFLSNRVHPSSTNKKIFAEKVRSRIHEVVYQAFDSYDGELPELGGD